MDIFITGATGFIGKRVLQELLLQDNISRIFILSRQKKLSLAKENKKVVTIQGDIRIPSSYERVLSQHAPVLIHLAGKVGLWSPNKQEFYSINVRGTRTILKTALENNVPKILYASSFFAIGPSRNLNADEVRIQARDKFFFPYEHSKYLADIYVSKFVEKGAPIIKFYPTYVYGPEEKAVFGNIIKGHLSRRFLSLGHMVGNGSTAMNWVYIDDVAKAILRLIFGGKIGRDYLISGYNHSFHTLFRYLSDLTGLPPMRPISPLMAKLFGFFEETKARLTRVPPLITKDGVKASMVDWIYGNTTMIKELGIIPTTLKEGLRKTLPYYYRLLRLPIPSSLFISE